MIANLARFVVAAPRAILAGTLVFLVGAVILGGNVAAQLDGVAANDPGADSARAAAILDSQFPGSRPDLVLLVEPTNGRGVDEPAIANQGRELAEALAAEPGITGVGSYWQTGSPTLRSKDGRQALIVARIAAPDENGADAVFNRIQPHYAGDRGDLRVALGGATAVRNAVRDTVTADLLRAEAIALPLTLLVLIVVFGSAVAALMPVLTGVLVIVGTSAALTLVARFATVSVFALNLTTVLGLGLAIDYGLLIVRRFRQELARQAEQGRPDPAAAVRETLRTAGRTVLFSAVVVAVSLAAMLVFPTPFLRSFAYAGLSVVALAALVVLLPLPAALVLLGRRVNALRIPLGRGDRVAREHRSQARWVALADAVMARAPLFLVATVALLVVLGLPFARVEFATVDHRQLPDGTPARVVQQDIKDGFDSQATGVIEVVVPSTDPNAVADYAARLSMLADVVRVDSPQGTFEGRSVAPAPPGRTAGGWSLVSVAPAASVEDVSPQSQALVRAIRDIPAPAGTLVGGQAAELLDTQLAIRHGLPWALAIIVVGTLVLLFLMTGSVLLPVKALVVNALSLTAMFGAVVWVFQQGHLSGLLGFTPTGFVEMSLPVLMFCLAFGLSMDYGIFLTARIKEEYDVSGDNRRAVAAGLAGTGGIVTSAALVMAIVLVAVGTSRIMNMQMLGLGVALAVVIDATVVRCLLVPAAMAIAGRATWWVPRALRRRHGTDEPAPPPREPVAAGRS
ncbi:MAG TPA: MMPL family transporter [Pseudonocardiaceae bacterium]|nr:MMPL family transporter [Pseudonocardiaceae bacterium]